MQAVGLQPMERYPGWSDVAWKCRCSVCGTPVYVKLSSIRKRKTPRRGCPACVNTRSGKAEAAWAELREAGLKPVEPYPGGDTAPRRLRCDLCEGEISVDMREVRARAADGLGGCPLCVPRRPRAGRGKKPRLRPEIAEAEFRAAGLEPLEPYPGLTSLPWRAQCTRCNAVISPRLGNVRRGAGCRKCTANRVAQKRRRELLEHWEEQAAERAETEFRAAGLEPQGAYPGFASDPWPARCAHCGGAALLSLAEVRAGRGCGCRRG